MNNQGFSKIWILVTLVVFLAGGILTWHCFGVSKEKIRVMEYVPGEIIVRFKNGTSKEEAIALIKSYGLEIKNESLWLEQFDFPIRVEVREDWFDRRGQLAREIEKEKIVHWASGEHDGIRIQFEENITIEEMKELINRYEMLSLIKKEGAAEIRVLLIKVPEGEELQWIQIFEKENAIDYAQLSYIRHQRLIE